jgi:acyl-coenzyme A thioesterase 13
MVDLGGSLAVASRGLYATGVSTDLNGELGWVQMQVLSETHIPHLSVTYLNSGGQIGDVLKAVVTCDKCEYHARRDS